MNLLRGERRRGDEEGEEKEEEEEEGEKEGGAASRLHGIEGGEGAGHRTGDIIR